MRISERQLQLLENQFAICLLDISLTHLYPQLYPQNRAYAFVSVKHSLVCRHPKIAQTLVERFLAQHALVCEWEQIQQCFNI